DGHLGPKTAAPGRNAAFCEAVSKPLTQLASPVGVGGTDETRPAPAGAVRIQSELRYDQSLTTDVLEAQVEPPSVVRENPQLGDFVREPLSLPLVVCWAGAYQYRQPSADRLPTRSATIVFPAHRRVADPLND